MQIKRILPKRMLPLAAAMIMCVGVAQARPSLTNDRFESQNNSEMALKKSEKSHYDEWRNSKHGFPWLTALTGACIALAGGLIGLGEYLDKKLDKEEADKAEEVEKTDKGVPVDQLNVKE